MTKNTGLGAVVPHKKIISYKRVIIAALVLISAAALALAGCRATPVDEFEGGSGSGSASGITIVEQPKSPDKAYLVDDPSVVPLVVKAAITGGSAETAFQYQWYSQSGDNEPQKIPESEGGTGDSYTPPVTTPGMTQYFVEVSTAGGADSAQISPALSNTACVWVADDDAPVIVSIAGGSLNTGAYLENGQTGAQIHLTSIAPGWAAYNLDPGVWTLKDYAPDGKSVVLAPSTGSIEVEAGKPQLLTVNVSGPSANGGEISLNVIGVVGVLPEGAVLIGPDNAKLSAAGGSRNYYELAPGAWSLSGLPSDGSITTNPNPPVVIVAAGETKVIGVIVNLPVLDTDGDGYPDAWEEAHANDGYDPTVPNKPYGIDLSCVGAPPPGVTWSVDTSAYTVQPSADGSFTEYQVYHSDPSKDVASGIIVAAGAKGSLIVSDNEDFTLRSTGEANMDVLVTTGADVVITLDGVTFKGGTPIEISPGAKATLLLAGTNTLTGGAEGVAGINVPSTAELVIDSASATGSENGSLTVTGGSAPYNAADRPADVEGCGAGIGGNFREGAGSITILGGTIDATSGNTGDTWSGAAGIGGGGQLDNVIGENGGGTILIRGGRVSARNGSGSNRGAAIGAGTFAENSKCSIKIEGTAVVYAYHIGGTGDPAAIGGARGANCGNVTISGGTVVAVVDNLNSPSIGGGAGASGGSIKITGGTVIANGKIGIGNAVALAPVSISGTPVIFALGIQGNSTTAETHVASNPGIGILANGEGAFSLTGSPNPATAGTVTVSGSFTVQSGATLTVPPGWTVGGLPAGSYAGPRTVNAP